MKNIQIIDGAVKSLFEIYAVPEDIFRIIFIEETDVAFIDEVEGRLDLISEFDQVAFWSRVYQSRQDKKNLVGGIHGTLHLTGSPCGKEYFSTGEEREVVNRGS